MLQDLLAEYLKEQCANGQLQAFLKARMPVVGTLIEDNPFDRQFHDYVANCRVQFRWNGNCGVAFAHKFPHSCSSTPVVVPAVTNERLRNGEHMVNEPPVVGQADQDIDTTSAA